MTKTGHDDAAYQYDRYTLYEIWIVYYYITMVSAQAKEMYILHIKS